VSAATVPEGTVAAGGRAQPVVEREALWIAPVLAFATLVFLLLPRTLAPDTWLALSAGREVARGLPGEDTLTVWTAGARWIDQQWLGQLAWYGIASLGGVRLAALGGAVAIVAAIAALLATARRNGASPRAVAAAGCAAMAIVAPSTAVRTQTLGYVLFALVLVLLLADARARSPRVLLVLPLLVLWANVHGSVLVGALLVMLAAAVRAVPAAFRSLPAALRLREAALLVAAPLCALATPYGPAIGSYYAGTLGNDGFATLVAEWQPTSFPGDLPFFVAAFGAVWLLARHGSRLTAFERLAVPSLVLLGLVATRYVVWLGLLLAAVAPRLVDAAWSGRHDAPLRPRLNALLLASLGLALAASVAAATSAPQTRLERDYPAAAAAAVRALDRDGEARVFATERFADWLLWTQPSLAGRLAYDARFELLKASQLRDVVRVKSRSGDWLRLLDGYDVVVLERDLDPVAAALVARGATIAFRDDRVTVLSRSGVT
jgi:hypothetical protein